MQKALFDRWDDVVPNIKVGDIFFIQNIQTTSRLIRTFTNSYWSHVGLVFEILHPDAENRITLVIEALPNGIEIHRLREYVNTLGSRRIGIKRFPGLKDEHIDRIKGFFLDTVDTPYDFSRLYPYFLSAFIERLSGVDVFDYLARKSITIENFICSSFVQRAFYLALPPEERERAIFRKGRGANLLYQLEVCSPADIARSTKADWLWNPHT